MPEPYHEQIIGGEAVLWGEQHGQGNYQEGLWPRVAAAAERLYSPEHVRSPACMQNRLRYFNQRLLSLGRGTMAMQPE